jgi:hypothetical protein
MIIENKCDQQAPPNLNTEDQRSSVLRFGGSSFQTFFYKHETTYRGLKFYKIE